VSVGHPSPIVVESGFSGICIIFMTASGRVFYNVQLL
jgi:hypothetical protein